MPNPAGHKFATLCQKLGAPEKAEALFEALVQRYGEPQRAYHNLNHILQCLDEFESLRDLAENPEAVEWAIWYHDAVYDSKAKDNEEQSVALFLQAAPVLNLSPSTINAVSHLILATKHDRPPQFLEAKIIVDVDLSILGQPADIFDRYEKNIRVEYSWVPEKDFIIGRAKVLRAFLERPSLYSTQVCADKYEAQARKNLERSLTALQNS